MAKWTHLFSSRTQKLSTSAATISRRALVKIAHRQVKGTHMSSFFSCVPGMAFIQSELNRPRVVTAKCSEPQVIISNGNDEGSDVAILSSVRTET